MTTWLAMQIEEKGWTIRELGRRAGVSHTAVAKAVSGETVPSADTCINLARALGVQPEWVLRLAGRLPPLPPQVANERELLHLYRNLNAPERMFILNALRGVVRGASVRHASPRAEEQFLFMCTVKDVMELHNQRRNVEAVAKLLANITAEDQRNIQDFLRLLDRAIEERETGAEIQIEAEAGGSGETT
ncbi:MAG: helix-turn-helix transcriptional regulator [Phycisphaerales bacterium]